MTRVAFRGNGVSGSGGFTRHDRVRRADDAAEAVHAWAAPLMQFPEAVLVTDASDRIRWVNIAAAEMTGWVVAELSGMPLGQLLAMEELDQIARTRGMTGAGGLRRYHCMLITKSGGQCEVSVSVGRSGEADAGATIYVLRDLRRQREVEGRLEAFRRQASGILHDLRQMSNVLGLTVKNFLRHHEDPAFRDEALRTLEEIAGQTGHLLDRLAWPAPPAALRREPTTLGDLVRRALDLLASAGHRANVAATLVQGLDRSRACEVDTAEMLRVVFNLLLNAYEAMPDGGRVTVRGEDEADGPYVRLVVEDTGPGLAPSYLEHDLFQPFRSTKLGGLGLGLYQARAIVEAHGGTLQAANRHPRGARFTIRLPGPCTAPASARPQADVPA